MAHEIKPVEDGILWVKLSEDMDLEDILAYTQDLQAFLDTVPETEKLQFLADASQMGKMSARARKAITDMFRNPDPRIGDSAMVGGSRYVRVLGGFVMKAAGRDDVRFFDSEEEAVTWLKERG
jgi:hypothetical protein